MRKKLLLITYFVILPAFGANFYSFSYMLKKGDTYNSLLKRFVKSGSVVNAKSPTVVKTIEMNPHIENWRKLPVNKKVKLYYEKPIFDLDSYKAYKKTLKPTRVAKKKKKKKQEMIVAKKEKQKKPPSNKPTGLKMSLFYMTSSGSFNQRSSKDRINIDFSQNSPYTLGFSALYYPYKKPYAFSTSLYLSKLNVSTSNAGEDVTIPSEFGITAYMQHDLYEYDFSYYAGVDFESFSTFNTGQFANTRTVGIDNNKVFYLTLGISKFKQFGSYPLYFRGSISKSLATSTTPAPRGVAPTTEYSGFKTIFYVNYKFHKRWFAHFLAKLHSMSGPDDLTVTRLGIGVGYILK